MIAAELRATRLCLGFTRRRRECFCSTRDGSFLFRCRRDDGTLDERAQGLDCPAAPGANMRPLTALLLALMPPPAAAQTTPREADLKLPMGGTPGPLDAITDVAGVEVGHATLISGSGKLVVGQGPVRTGVTVIHPRGRANHDPVFAAWCTLNGNGEMTGTTWVQESGLLEGPVAITNTHSVGVVRDAQHSEGRVSKKNPPPPPAT